MFEMWKPTFQSTSGPGVSKLHDESLKDHRRLAIMEFQDMSKTKSYTDGVIFIN